MNTSSARGPRAGKSVDLAGLAPSIFTVGAVLLAWQIVIQPLKERAPAELAARVAPGSALVLSRAAEAELTAGRTSNAVALAKDAVGRAPFDVRAVRVLGLSEAKAGHLAQADDLLTLAGNWSLRDDPSHAWLVERRLRQGDYASAFGHADTLMRRREDIWPQTFKLFTTAAVADPKRALPVIAGLLEANSTWRLYYLNSLYATTDGLRVAVPLALLLKNSRAPLNDVELSQLYSALLSGNQIEALKAVRAELKRPALNSLVTNGDFEDQAAVAPFQWQLIQKSGALADIMPDDAARGDNALWVQYDGYTSALVARQIMLLAPGRYRLRADHRTDEGRPADRLAWRIFCLNGPEPVLSIDAAPGDAPPSTEWRAVSGEFTVPAGCPGQWLHLEGRPDDRRSQMAVWFDRVSVTAISSGGGG